MFRDRSGRAASPRISRRGLVIGSVGATVAASLAATGASRVAAPSPFMSGQGFPYAAFDALPSTDLTVQGGVIHLAVSPGSLDLPADKLLAWVRRGADAVVAYYGRFPVRSLRLLIVPVAGGRVQGGTTWGYRGAAIRIPLGVSADETDLLGDWVMTHEMVHLALPDVDDDFTWLAEGMAVYIEPIARVQSGELTDALIWADMARDMPRGLPGLADGGLDGTREWGRTYWGGALFCLMADVEIRKRTDNRLGLQDAMRGVLAAGGDHEADWSAERIFETADKAVGRTVLADLHAEMGPKPSAPDLAALWRDLGVAASGDRAVLDDDAPLAAIRAAITRRR